MTMTFNRRQALGFSVLPLVPARAQKPLKSASLRICRGISFHHVLNWPAIQSVLDRPSYVWPPFQGDKYKLKSEDLNLVQSLGFDFVRLTVDPGLWIAGSESRNADLERLYREIVEAILSAGLNIVFDLAPVDNHPDYSPARLISPDNAEGFANYALMVQRAARLLSKWPRHRVALEMFNEPPLQGAGGEARWARMQEVLHARAREAAPDLVLILTAAHWGDFAALTRLDPNPYRHSDVLYTFHYYEPHLFTHQGAKSGAISYVSGLDWPLRRNQLKGVQEEAERAILAESALREDEKAQLRDLLRRAFSDAARALHDEAAIAGDFEAVRAWAKAAGVPAERVVLGEFGCVASSRGRLTGEGRRRWLRAVRTAAEAQGFPWAYWAFKGYGGMELLDAQGALRAELVEPLGLAPPR